MGNDVFIKIERNVQLTLKGNVKHSPFEIVVEDSYSRWIVETFANFYEVRQYFENHSYRKILEIAENQSDDDKRLLEHIEQAKGFYVCGDHFSVQKLDYTMPRDLTVPFRAKFTYEDILKLSAFDFIQGVGGVEKGVQAVLNEVDWEFDTQLTGMEILAFYGKDVNDLRRDTKEYISNYYKEKKHL